MIPWSSKSETTVAGKDRSILSWETYCPWLVQNLGTKDQVRIPNLVAETQIW